MKLFKLWKTRKIVASSEGYLDPDSVKSCVSDTGNTLVKVYSNGLWDCAPDPRNERAVQGCEDSYNNGYFVRYKTYRVDRNSLPD